MIDRINTLKTYFHTLKGLKNYDEMAAFRCLENGSPEPRPSEMNVERISESGSNQCALAGRRSSQRSRQ